MRSLNRALGRFASFGPLAGSTYRVASSLFIVRYLPATLTANEAKTTHPATPQRAKTTRLAVESPSPLTRVMKNSDPIMPNATDAITKMRVAVLCMSKAY